jgi:hypothetical protein
MTKANKLKIEYFKFFLTLINDWSKEGKVYAITGNFGVSNKNIPFIENHYASINYMFNYCQRKLVGSRRWGKEKHRMVKVLIVFENSTLLHYHGVMLIPHYYFKKNRFNNDISDELKELRLYDIYTKKHRKTFNETCYIRPLNNVELWINYIMKYFIKSSNNFDCYDYMILP